MATIDSECASRLSSLLFDIDDTLLSAGELTQAALGALHQASQAGLRLIAVTGRPAQWGQVLAQLLPLDGVVTENGSLCWKVVSGRPVLVDPLPPEQRSTRRLQLIELVSRLRARVPELEPSDDVSARITDYTFDIGEYRSVDRSLVEQATDEAHALGMRVLTSSVHLHVGLDAADKASGTLWFLENVFAVDPTRARFESAFVGDSQNDASCFAAFEVTIGVANLHGEFTLRPRYHTASAMGKGFAEAVSTLVRARSGSARANA